MASIFKVNGGTKTYRIVNAGRHATPVLPEGTRVVKFYDKAARRIARAKATRGSSRIGKALRRCRDDDREVALLATNSHQRKRAIEQDRKER